MLIIPICFGHFTMVGSREQRTYSGPERFDPVSGGVINRPDNDCFSLQNLKPKVLIAGKNAFKFEIGANDALPGLCTAYIIKSNGAIEQINTQQDCISNFEEMSVTIPNAQCDGCVLKIVVQAEKQKFDSCIDIKIQLTAPINLETPISSISKPASISTLDNDLKTTAPISTPTVNKDLKGTNPADPNTDGYRCSLDGVSYEKPDGFKIPIPSGKSCTNRENGIALI